MSHLVITMYLYKVTVALTSFPNLTLWMKTYIVEQCCAKYTCRSAVLIWGPLVPFFMFTWLEEAPTLLFWRKKIALVDRIKDLCGFHPSVGE